MGESGSAWFVIGSPLKGEFSIYIEYLSDRTDTVGCIWAATGSMIAGLHRHISVLAGFRARLSVRIYVTRLFCFSSKAKTSGCPTHSFQKKTKEVKAMSQVFRVERNKNFTVMANYHLKDKRLSLKAKGLLSVMLSLPDDWNYNMKGLARLSKDGLDSVRSTVNELEWYGYVTRRRIRTETGQLADTEYLVRERPLDQEEQPTALRTDSPGQENQLTGGANDGFPNTGDPNTIKD